MTDMYEVQAGQIAKTRAQSDDVKKFAQHMIDDHTKNSNELKTVVMKSAKDVALPTELGARHKGMLDNLKGASAADFEGRYIAQQINAHNEALVLMRGYAKDGDNAALKSFAAKTEPVVQMHLDMIENIDRAHRVKDSQAQNSGTANTKTKTR